jgi:hypothetical protein
MRDHRIGLDLFNDVLDVLDRHGFARGDDEHAGRAIFLIGDLARIYEGAQDHPFGPSINPAPSPQMAPEPPGPDSRDAVAVPVSELKAVLLALDTAADDLRDQVELCTHCPDQSCPPASPASATPTPTTSWPSACSGPPKPPRPHAPARPNPPAPPGSPGPPPTRRPASDPPRQDTGRTREPEPDLEAEP